MEEIVSGKVKRHADRRPAPKTKKKRREKSED
jgi:hypothetical protein